MPIHTYALTLAAAVLTPAPAPVPPPDQRITLVRTFHVPPDATDASGLSETIAHGLSHNRLGAFGSAIDYLGGDDYLVLPDRGPADGAVPYHTRIHLLHLPLASDEPFRLVRTTLLTDESGRALPGLAAHLPSAADAAPAAPRFDPEGVRSLTTGNFVICDEYGPHLFEFSPMGAVVRRIPVPAGFLAARPAATPDDELPPHALTGRQPNRGFEGLALTPSGRLVAILQSPLIQDGALDQAAKRRGTNIRVLEFDPATSATRQFVYRLDDPRYGVSEILALDDHRFLTIERDGKPGGQAAFKRIMLVDFSSATDVSAIDALPSTTLPAAVNPGVKRTFIDLLDPAFGLAGSDFPEKIEGLCFGPDLPAAHPTPARRTLVVTSDNDFSDAPSVIWFFAIEPSLFTSPPPALPE